MTPHGQHQLGVILALPDLAEPHAVPANDLRLALDAQNITHRLLVTRKPHKVPGWRNIAVDMMPYEMAVAVAHKHCQSCESVVVLNSTVWPVGVDAVPLKPAPFTSWAPVRGIPTGKAWEGAAGIKPWDFAVECHLAVLDPGEHLEVVIALLRAQSVRPFIVLTDTGSLPENLDRLEAMRAPDLEIHSLRFAGNRHPSDPVAVACDLAFAMCRTEKIVMTHDDVFLRQRTSLEQLLEMTSKATPAVGFQMTPRDHPLWTTTVAHSLACFHMPTMRRIGATWSLRRAAEMLGAEHDQHGRLLNALDTETAPSLVLGEFGIKPLLIGEERNFEQTIHPMARHCRTTAGAKLYSPAHYAKAQGWIAEAIDEAAANLTAWNNHP